MSIKQEKQLSEAERVKKDKELISALEEGRQDAEKRWDFAIEYVNPALGKWGEKEWEDKRIDTAATEASETAKDGMFGNLISQASSWVEYGVNIPELEKDNDFAEYLKDRGRQLYTELQDSNFYDDMPAFIHTGVSVGSAPILIDDDEEGRIFLSPLHPYEIYITKDKFGRINRVIRKFQLTAEQAEGEFEDSEKFSQPLKEAIEETPQTKFWFYHVLEKRKDRDKEKDDADNMPVASRYFEEGGTEDGDVYLREGGFKTWPLPVWLYDTRVGDDYGYCPTDIAGPIILVCNQLQKAILRATQKALDPNKQAPKSLKGRIDDMPGGTTWLDDMNSRVLEMPGGGELPVTMQELNEEREHVKRVYKVDHFLMLLDQDSSKEMTRYEVMERKGEKITVIGATVGRFVSILEQILTRIDQLADDAGRMPLVPEKYLTYAEKMKLNFRFLGPLAQAQKQAVNTQGLMAALETCNGFFAISNDSVDNIDADEAVRDIFTVYGAADKLKDIKDRDDLRKARAEMIEQEKKLAQAQAMGTVMKDVGASGLGEQMAKQGQQTAQKVGV